MLEFRVQQALKTCDFFIAIGTSGTVYPAAGYVQTAAAAGAETVLVNAEAPHNIAFFRHFYQGPASRVLPPLLGVG
jgi:NAD-dependent deacetylase